MGLQDATIPRWGEKNNRALGVVNSTLGGIWEKTITKIEAHAGMAERLMKDLAIEDDLKEEIKDTLQHNDQSYGRWSDQTDKK